MLPFSFTIFVQLVCSQAQGSEHPFFVRGQYEYVTHSTDRDDHSGRLETSARLFKTNHLGLSWESEARRYPLETLQDHRLACNGSAQFGSHFYVEAEGAHTFSPDFWGRWSGMILPHGVTSSGWDIASGVRFQDYRETNTWIWIAMAIYEWKEWRFTGRSDLLIKPRFAWSGAGTARWNWSRGWIEMNAGGGKADDGDGITDRFYQVRGQLAFRTSKTTALWVDTNQYRGKRRQEGRWGTGFQIFF